MKVGLMKMLVKFFKRGGVSDNRYSTGGQAVKDYLLNERVEQGTAFLLKGDPDQTTDIINGLGYSKIFTSGCLSFDSDESERVTDELKQELMQGFERALFGDFDKTRVSGYWVEHTDKKDEVTGKSRLELNFVFANVDLLSGKNLPVYYEPNDLYRIDTYKDLANLTHNLSDPNDPRRKQISIIDNNQSQSRKDIKTDIHNLLTQKFIMGNINCRDDVIQTLVESGFEITKIAPKSLSIKHPQDDKPQPIRLKGAFYEQQFQSSDYIATATVENKPTQKNRAERIAELSSKLESAISKRTQSLNERLRPNHYRRHSKRKKRDNEQSIELRHDTADNRELTQQSKRADITGRPEFYESLSISDYQPRQEIGINAEPSKPSFQRFRTVESGHDSTAHHQQTATIGDLDSLNNHSSNRGNYPINLNHHQWKNVALAISMPSDNRNWRGSLGGYGCYQESKQRERINELKSNYRISFTNVREAIGRYAQTTKQSYSHVAAMAKSACKHLQGRISERYSEIDNYIREYRPIASRYNQRFILESAKTDIRLGDIGEQFNNFSNKLDDINKRYDTTSQRLNDCIQSANDNHQRLKSTGQRLSDCLEIIAQKNKVKNEVKSKVDIAPPPPAPNKTEPPKPPSRRLKM